MMISGALAGLAGSIFYLGIEETILKPGLDIPAQGFQGITLSLIAFNNPLGLFGSTLFVGMMTNAKAAINAEGINPYITDAILALTIFGASLANFFVIYRPHDKFLN
jgi:simple sugar transport system permease protein